MHRVFRHLRVLWRVERTIAEARLRVTLRRSVLYALAAMIAVFGIGMLNVAAFFALVTSWGPTWAAGFAAGGDFVLALVLAVTALVMAPGAEFHTAVELRQEALNGIDEELAALQDPLGWLSSAARRHPIDAALPVVMVPLLTAIVRGLRKRKKAQP